MKITVKKTISIALALFMVLVLCSCGSGSGPSGSGNQSGKLDLDYEEGSSQQSAKQESGGGNWFSEAFNFGKKEDSNSSSQSSQSSALQDLYSDSSENSQQGSNQGQSGSSQNQSGFSQNQSSSSANTNQGSSQQSGSFQGGGSGNQSANSGQQTSDNSGQNTNTGQNGIAGNSSGSNQSGSGNQNQGSGKTVTITIRCDTAVNNGMHLESKWAGIVPASGCILPVTTVEIEDGQTVFDVLAYVCSKYKIHMSYRGGTSSGCYVDGINNLYEFDGGRWSGWMYCVNKWYPNYGCGVYYVKAGDEIEWNYTCDLGLDLEGGDVLGGSEWKETHP